MSRLSKQSIRKLCEGIDPLIVRFQAHKVRINGKSGGLSHASYDCHIGADLTLGVHPGFIVGKHTLENSEFWHPRWLRLLRCGKVATVVQEQIRREQELAQKLEDNPPCFALAHTKEDFAFPANLSGQVADKSTYARLFVSAFNTVFDCGFRGNATLELVNHSDEPVVIREGDPICQFLFDELDEPSENPYNDTCRYQGQTKQAHEARYEHADGTWAPRSAVAGGRP